MNLLEKCIESFENLLPVKYRFHIAGNKIITEIVLDFEIGDFKHLVGLQYLRDVAMSRNSAKVYETIMKKKFTFEKIEKSAFFEKVDNSYANVKERMTYFPMLNEFIETENIILRYVKYKNPYSKITADYMIESSVNGVTAYIFLKKRNKDEDDLTYAVISFFLKDHVEYRGETRYWLLKERIELENNEILYKKNGYEIK